MGLAASQARFLQLTARKSNLEFMGQQINQERLLLANESSGLYEEQLTLNPPVPPSTSSDAYMSPAYVFTDAVTGQSKTIQFIFDTSGNVNGATITYNSYDETGDLVIKTVDVLGAPAIGSAEDESNGITNSDWQTDVTFDSATGRLDALNLSVWDTDTSSAVDTAYTNSDFTYSPIFDETKYNDDMNEYEYQTMVYNNRLEQLNAETSQLQDQDRSLELKLKQLDTERTAIQNEMEAVQKVLQTNIEGSFKTFSA